MMALFTFVVFITAVVGTFSLAQSNSWHGVIIWSLYGLCRLALAANRLTVVPRPSQAPFLCEVAKKRHSAEIAKSTWW